MKLKVLDVASKCGVVLVLVLGVAWVVLIVMGMLHLGGVTISAACQS